jgi:hypothetical protein
VLHCIDECGLHRNDIQIADKLLRERGFTLPRGSFPLGYYRAVHFHVIYVRDSGPGSIPIEIHWGLKDRFSVSGVGMDEIWARAHPWSTGKSAAHALCTDDLLAYLCYHAEKHSGFSRYIEDFTVLESGAVLGSTAAAELLWYADILRLIDLKRGTIDWDTLAKNCRSWGIEGEVYTSLAVTDRIFGTSVAGAGLALLEPPRPRKIQAGIYRRIMTPPSGDARTESTGNQRLLESGTGLQFRSFKALDILGYIFPDPHRVSRCYSVSGSKPLVRYVHHTLTAAGSVISCLGFLIGSLVLRAVNLATSARRRGKVHRA